MKNNNPLDNFQTDSYTYTGFKGGTAPAVCPTLPEATQNPIKLVDYMGCHKLLLIFIIAIIGLVIYSGVKAKVAADPKAGGGKDGGAKK